MSRGARRRRYGPCDCDACLWQDLEPKDLSTWRATYPQQQPWRSLSWRAHKLAEARREETEADAMAREESLRHQQHMQQVAATSIEAGVRGMKGRQYSQGLRREKEAAAAAAAAAEAEEAELAAASKGGANARGRRHRGRSSAV